MIKFLDLHKINARFETEFKAQFDEFLDSGRYILGDYVSTFEKHYAKFCGTAYCVGTANGLDALTLILKGYQELGQLKKGDEVIVPANTFIATILSVLHAGLKPVFVEPNSNTFNIDSKAIEAAITEKTKAVIVVHLYGQLADVTAVKQIAERQNILVIEDAAQAHGAIDNNGNKAGNLGDAAAFSFYPSKNLGALGDGGAVTTNNEKLHAAVAMLRNYGSSAKYINERVGYNSRLDDIQAMFLNIKLKRLESDNKKRREIARRYISEINNSKIKLPKYNGSENHVFYAFVVQTEDREALTSFLEMHHVGYVIHYPIPPHQQKALEKYNHLKLPITEHIHNTVLSLPISPVMTDEEVGALITIVNQY